jgi:MFS family permease
MASDTFSSRVHSSDAETSSRRRLAIGFLNWAHALDHFIILIFPTVAIGLEASYGRSYSDLIALSTASFIAFGLFSLPAGWLADRWSRRNMMAAFYFGCGLSLVGAAFAPSLWMLAAALFALGVFAAIYHPVGTAMLIETATQRGRSLAFNGVCGNLGVSLAAGITAALTAAFSPRGAFLVPGLIAIATGAAYVWLAPDEERHASKRSSAPDVALSMPAAVAIFALFMVVALTAGLVFNTLTVALPKIVDERIGGGIPLVVVGGLSTAVFLCGGLAQIAVAWPGRSARPARLCSWRSRSPWRRSTGRSRSTISSLHAIRPTPGAGESTRCAISSPSWSRAWRCR